MLQTASDLRPAARAGLSGTALKLIALALMLLDHIHYFFEFTGLVPLWFTQAGRLAAPLFLFCTAEGFAHTHDRKRYFLRIWAIGASMAALLYCMMYLGLLCRGDGFYPANGIFQSFVVLCVLWQGMDWLCQRRVLWGLTAILGIALWPFAAQAVIEAVPALTNPVVFLVTSPVPAWTNLTDGGLLFIIGGMILYGCRKNRRVQLTLWVMWSLGTDFVLTYFILRSQAGFVWTQMFTEYFSWFEVFAALLMAAYNGRRGRGYKRLFYWFYPAHVYILYGASCLLYAAAG